MSRAQRASNEFVVSLPKEALVGEALKSDEVARELRVLWLIEKVRRRQMGYGKAAELSGLPLARFLGKMGEHAVSPWDYDEGEVARQVEVLDRLLGSSSPTPDP